MVYPCAMSVRLEPAKRIVVTADSATVADTTRGYVVHESGLPPRYYVPRSDVRATLSRGTGQGECPWKGSWEHVNVAIGERTIANGAWTYPTTTPVCEPIRDFVAFYDTKLQVAAT